MKSVTGKLPSSRVIKASVSGRARRFQDIKKLARGGKYKVNSHATAQALARALDSRIFLIRKLATEL